MDVSGNALIVGGGSGIGRACALGLAQEGAAGMLVADRDVEAASKVAAECRAVATAGGFRVEAVYVDLTDEDSVGTTVDHMEVFGRIDYCVNCARIGVEQPRETAEADLGELRRFLGVHVEGTFLLTRSVSAAMKRQPPADSGCGTSRGSILVLGSASSYAATPGLVQYTTAKHALVGLTKNAALDNAAYGIRANCVCPSWVETPMTQRVRASGVDIDGYVSSMVPLGRIASADEVADVVVFCSARASYVTGCGMVVDGGTKLTSRA